MTSIGLLPALFGVAGYFDADEISYDTQSEVVDARGNLTLLDSTGHVVFADRAKLTGGLREGFIRCTGTGEPLRIFSSEFPTILSMVPYTGPKTMLSIPSRLQASGTAVTW